MSTTTIRKVLKIAGTRADFDSVVFSNEAGTLGVWRTDTGASVVAAGTSLTRVSIGRYEYAITDPAANLEYGYWIKAVYGGETYYFEGVRQGTPSYEGNLYDVLPRIETQLQDAPQNLVKQVLRNVLRQWCKQTETFRVLVAFDSVADQQDYALVLDWAATIYRLVEVTFGTGDDGIPVTASLTGDEEVRLAIAPSVADDEYEASLVLLPEPDCVTVPPAFLDRYSDALVAGTLSYIKRISGRPYTDREGANEARAEYLTERGRAISGLLSGHSDAPVIVGVST